MLSTLFSVNVRDLLFFNRYGEIT